jgi:hypothetical protein
LTRSAASAHDYEWRREFRSSRATRVYAYDDRLTDYSPAAVVRRAEYVELLDGRGRRDFEVVEDDRST